MTELDKNDTKTFSWASRTENASEKWVINKRRSEANIMKIIDKMWNSNDERNIL